jgi:hypothetical protein
MPQAALRAFCFLIWTTGSVTAGWAEPGDRVEFCMANWSEPCRAGLSASLLARLTVKQGNRQFCERLKRGKWQYVKHDVPHFVPPEEARKYLTSVAATGRTDRSGRFSEMAAYVDINNDGTQEYVVLGTLYSGAASGCDVEIYVPLDETRTKIQYGPLASVLSQNDCRTLQRAINYEGKVYLETRSFYEDVSILHKIVSVVGNSTRLACEFRLR